MDAGGGGNFSPRAVPFEALKRLDGLVKVHAPMLGAHASPVNAFLRKASVQHMEMREKEPPPTVFHENLIAIIGDGSVNSFAVSHKLEQTTIQRIVDGQDPKLSTVLKIANAIGVAPWELLTKNLQINNRPIVQGAAGPVEEALWKRIESLMAENLELKEAANTSPTPLEARGMSVFGELEADEHGQSPVPNPRRRTK